MSNQAVPQLIAYQSWQYHQACQLRYKLFFAEHNLPWSVLEISREFAHEHVAMVLGNSVVAYGQLASLTTNACKIHQMVVKSNYQGQNLGLNTMLFLQDLAQQRGASILVLDARVSAVGFYRKCGFRVIGEKFPSIKTGVNHVPMQKCLEQL